MADPVLRPHPLHNLNPAEIRRAAQIVSQTVREREKNDGYGFRIKNISLHEPPKALLMPYLDAESAGVPAGSRPYIPRLASVIYTTNGGRDLYESVVSLDTGTEVSLGQARKGQHAHFDR